MKTRTLLSLVGALGLASTACSTERNANDGDSSLQIFEGRDAADAEYAPTADLWAPGEGWFQDLQVGSRPAFDQKCTGAFIHPRVVLTAAHCVAEMDFSSGQMVAPSADTTPFYRVRLPGSFALDAMGMNAAVATRKDEVIARMQDHVNKLPSQSAGAPIRAVMAKIKAGQALSGDELNHAGSALVQILGVAPQKIVIHDGFKQGDLAKEPDLALILLPEHGTPLSIATLSTVKPVNGAKVVQVGHGLVDESADRALHPAPRPKKLAENTLIAGDIEELEVDADPELLVGIKYDPKLAQDNPAYGAGCGGDSGGPVYKEGTLEILGVTSHSASNVNGGERCVKGQAHGVMFTRVDTPTSQAWISSTLKAWGLASGE